MNLLFKLGVLVFLGMFNSTYAQLSVITQLPKTVKESSGLAYDGTYLWTHNDSGDEAVLYGLDPDSGKVAKKIYPKSVRHVDWEDLAYAQKGIVFIGDFGNNNFSRKTVSIYGFYPYENDTPKSQEIVVKFPEQYTSSKGKIQFDIEAFVFIGEYFYLFTKTKKNKFEGLTRVFQVNAAPGEQTAVYCGAISLCKKSGNCKITGAAYHKRSNRLALLSHKNVWVIDNFDPKNLDVIESLRMEFSEGSQKEGITFKDSNTLLISEERNKGSQRLFELLIKRD